MIEVYHADRQSSDTGGGGGNGRDRSHRGTGCSARMSVMHARGEPAVGKPCIARSIIDSRLRCSIAESLTYCGRPAVVPTIAGRG